MVTAIYLRQRLHTARVSAGLSQADVAAALGVARPTISQIESGKRAVSGVELVQLARLYGRPIEWFVDEDGAAASDEDALTVLFRAVELQPEDRAAALHFQSLCRSSSELERLVNQQVRVEVPEYSSAGDPQTKGEAIRQGERVASEERRRLGLGDAPIRNMMDLLETQGVRIFALPLHDRAISGIFLYERELGPCILVNREEPRSGLPFNAAHEYAHLLFDRRLRARVSTAAKALESGNGREELLEVQANSFAAAFLLPAGGIERYLGQRDMTRRNRQSLSAVDIVYLQHAFGVSYQVALDRLQNLGWLDRARHADPRAAASDSLARSLGVFDETSVDPHENIPYGSSRYWYLALEAYREGKISLGKLAELLGMGIEDVRDLVWELQVEPDAASAQEAVV